MSKRYARLALAVILVLGATFAAGLAARTSFKSAHGAGFSAKTGDPDAGAAKSGSAQATAAIERGPAAQVLAEEQYQQRAYPAEEVTPAATAAAQQAWAKLQTRGSKGKNTAGQWTLIGPSHADMPGLLVFSGADYTTSGRITTHGARPRLLERDVPRLDRRRRRRRVADLERPLRLPEVGVRVRGPAVERDRRAGVRRGVRHALRRHRRAELLGRQRGGRRPVQVDRRRNHLDDAPGGHDDDDLAPVHRATRSRIARSARSRSTRRTRTSSTSLREARFAASARCRTGATPGLRRRCPAAA